MIRKQYLGMVVLCLALGLAVRADVISFEDVNLPIESYWNGAEEGLMSYTSESVTFFNGYNADWDWWTSWLAVSNITDTQAAGYISECHAVTGQGVFGSPNYGISYALNGLTLEEPSSLSGLYVTNNNYAYYTMVFGDDFAKAFGGTDGNDADWFILTITGLDVNDMVTGRLDVYLADFRFEDSVLDYIVSDWTYVDLRALGEVKSLNFALSSSDTGMYGMNTPNYFALDGLVFPDSSPFEQLGVAGFDDENQTQVNPVFRAWASTVVDYSPAGALSIMGTSYADSIKSLGVADREVVSLGELTEEAVLDGNEPGFITVAFGNPEDANDPNHIVNQSGYDFVVFENGIFSQSSNGDAVPGQLFAELAYVEVSTNGVDFVRFPNASLTEIPKDLFGTIDTPQVHNLAGIHPNTRATSLGTPFDLQDLAGTQAVINGIVDINDIRFVRLVDIPGFGGYADTQGHPIYDPTGGWTNGFDLDAIGVLHAQAFSGDINLDGVVDELDQEIMQENLNLHFGQNDWLSRTDLNGDWRTDQADLILFTEQLGSVESWRLLSGNE